MAKKVSFDMLEQNLSLSDTPKSDNTQLQRELRHLVLRVMRDSLTPRQQQMLGLFFFQQKNTVEIAELLGVNKSTVSRTLNRGMNNLHRALRYYKLR